MANTAGCQIPAAAPCNINATWARLALDHSNPDPRGKSRPRISPPKRVPKGNHLARPELLCREERRETNTSKKCQRAPPPPGEGGASSLMIGKQGAAGVGVDPATVGGDSLRAGFVTSAVKGGANLIKITDVTGHKSLEMLKTYSRDAEAFVGHAGAGLL